MTDGVFWCLRHGRWDRCIEEQRAQPPDQPDRIWCGLHNTRDRAHCATHDTYDHCHLTARSAPEGGEWSELTWQEAMAQLRRRYARP